MPEIQELYIFNVHFNNINILYNTNLYLLMHHSLFVYILIHLHVFLASYLFTISIIHIVPRHHSDVFSTIVLVLALAGHIILSKTIYPTSPSSVPRTEGEIGSIMAAILLIYY
ncbi:MAG TPA: cytochrome c oxidase assembly protein [Staphylococcus sp.]|nr:cytochrome c oxidase assembly protein [Staphylococcus sp.]